MRKAIVSGLLLALGVAASAALAAADDHILLESRRTYMGRTYPPQTSEIWITADKTYARDGALITIERYDLGKRWRIDTRIKAYLEEDMPRLLRPSRNPALRPASRSWGGSTSPTMFGRER